MNDLESSEIVTRKLGRHPKLGCLRESRGGSGSVVPDIFLSLNRQDQAAARRVAEAGGDASVPIL